jgi:hypothetical protein
MSGRVAQRDFKEGMAKYGRKCFSCKEPVHPGERCFLAPPNGRRYWSVCCWSCGEARGWVVDLKQKIYGRAPAGSYWWDRLD